MTVFLDAFTLFGTGTPPATLPSDNFNRADAATLGTSSSGDTWDEHGTVWSIASNRARPPSGGSYVFATLDAGVADVTVEATVIPGGTPDIGLCARVVDSNNLVFFDFSWNSDHYECRVFQRVGGSFTGITSFVSNVTAVPNNTDPYTLTLTCTGAAGEAFANGVSQGTWTGLDSSLLTATSHGLASKDSHPVAFDDFSIT